MLNYKTLNKPIISLPNKAEECFDLLTQSCRLFENINGNVLIVNKYYVARPDLISLVTYGTEQYADIICKINGISNPFELNENMILILPTANELNKLYKSDLSKSSELISNNSIQSNSTTRTQKLRNERRSPAQQVMGESNYIIDKTNNLVFY